MKKLLAVLLAAVMLLSASALAESGRVTVKNIVVAADDQYVFDLTGFEAVIEGSVGDESAGLRVDFSANGSLGGVVAALLGQQLLVQFNGAGSNIYGMNLADFGIENAMRSLESIQAAGTGAASAEIVATVSALFEGSVTDGGVTQIEGMDFDTALVEITEDQFDALFQMILEQAAAYNSQAYTNDAAELLDKVAVSMSGAIYTNETVKVIDLTAFADMDEEGVQGAVNLYAVYVAEGAEDGDLLSLAVTVFQGDQAILGASADFEFAATSDTSWMQLDAGKAVDIQELIAAGEFESTLTTEFARLSTVVSTGAMSVIYANLAGQLSAQAE